MRQWLIAQREKKKLSQKDVSTRAHISQPTYWGYEHGERTPTVETAKKIAAVLGFDWTKFFEETK